MIKFLSKGFSILATTAAFVSAHALTMDYTGMTGSSSFTDGDGNSITTTIDHISSSSSAIQFIVDDIVGNGRSVELGPDLDGTMHVHEFGYADYGYNTDGFRVMGMTYGFSTEGTDIGNKSFLFYNGIQTPTGFWWSKQYGDSDLATFPLNPTPDRPTSDSVDYYSNYGWWLSKGAYTDTRIMLFGDITTDGDGHQTVHINDGVIMTAEINVVPEPTSMIALGLGASAFLIRRKKKQTSA